MLDSCSVMLLTLHELLANNHHITATTTQVCQLAGGEIASSSGNNSWDLASAAAAE
jgi:hypothetical protein